MLGIQRDRHAEAEGRKAPRGLGAERVAERPGRPDVVTEIEDSARAVGEGGSFPTRESIEAAEDFARALLGGAAAPARELETSEPPTTLTAAVVQCEQPDAFEALDGIGERTW